MYRNISKKGENADRQKDNTTAPNSAPKIIVVKRENKKMLIIKANT